MNLNLVKTSALASSFNQTSWGKVYRIHKPKLILGHYLVLDNKIPEASIHEYANSFEWFSNWKKSHGNFFGGKENLDFKIESSSKLKYLGRGLTKRKDLCLKGNYYLFQYTWDFNYHHFLLSAFSRLCAFEDVKNKNKNLKIIVKKSTPEYQKEFISNFYGEEIILIDDDKTYVFENVYIMDFIYPNAKNICEFFYTISKSFKKNDYFNKIYISRKDAGMKRHLKNTNDLVDLAKKNQYGEYILSKLKIIEKVKIFANSKKILTTFGAGAVNLIFCQNCEQIIFIEHPKYPIPKIYLDICYEKNIEVICIKSFSIKWTFLKLLWKIFNIFGYKKIEWVNNYSWNFSVRKLKKII